MPDPELTDERTSAAAPPDSGPSRRDNTRLILVAVIGAVMLVFALINLNTVQVHWLFATNHAPLILVIVLAFLLGAAADRLLVIRKGRKRANT
jgi:uncharacterized integral membrane protein